MVSEKIFKVLSNYKFIQILNSQGGPVWTPEAQLVGLI